MRVSSSAMLAAMSRSKTTAKETHLLRKSAESKKLLMLQMTTAPAKDMIWVGTDDGNVQLTRDGGKNWSNSAGRFPGLPANSWVQQIKASTYDEGTAVVVFDEHRRDDWTPYVYRTTN